MNRLIGRVPVWIGVKDSGVEDEIAMLFSDGAGCRWYHSQDCCENVEIEETAGDWSNLLGVPLLVAEERIQEDDSGCGDSNTWTFYTFRSIKGTVDVRWHGSSNGYYSESVDFAFFDNGEKELGVKRRAQPEPM